MLGLFGSAEISQRIQDAVFGMEFLLTFMIVLSYFRVTEHFDSLMAASAIGVSYMTAMIAFRGAVNPAFALGRAFVVNNFDNLWIFWVGPCLGGLCAALCHDFIFNEQKDVTVSMSKLSETPPESDAEDFETRSDI